MPAGTINLPGIFRCTPAEFQDMLSLRVSRMASGQRVQPDARQVQASLASRLGIDLRKLEEQFTGTANELAELKSRHPWFVGNWNHLCRLESGQGLDFNDLDLKGAFLYKVNLTKANLSGCDLRHAFLGHADLKNSNLQNANLHHANLYAADLESAEFKGCQLREAQLSNANLRDAKNFVLDGNQITGALFSHDSQDPYNVLRRTYSGPKFVLVLIFSLLAFLPIFFEIAILKTVGTLQDKVHAELLDPLSKELPRSTIGLKGWERVQIWKVITDFSSGVGPFSLNLAIILYNIARFRITLKMSQLAYEEERSGKFAPFREHYYNRIWPLHQYALRWVLVLSVLATAVKCFVGLTDWVWIPAGKQ